LMSLVLLCLSSHLSSSLSRALMASIPKARPVTSTATTCCFLYAYNSLYTKRVNGLYTVIFITWDRRIMLPFYVLNAIGCPVHSTLDTPVSM
jgi:hypothetical protein